MSNWNQVFEEIKQEHNKHIPADSVVRQRYLKKLSNKTSRNVIAYYSAWQQKGSSFVTGITDEDREAFMQVIHKMDREKGLDLILHTPGGSTAATCSLVLYLREMFDRNIRAIVPHTAMSGGTMIACACKSIIMGKHSSIGPIDPQLNGISAQGVLEEFERAYKEMKEDPQKMNVWQFILSKYTPSFIGDCEQAIQWAEEFTREQLESNMFYEENDKSTKSAIDMIIKKLINYYNAINHSRQINYKEAKGIGLKIEMLEDNQELQDLVLTVHHCFTYTLSNTPCLKIVENQNGAAFTKNQSVAKQ